MNKIVLLRASSKQSFETLFKALHVIFAANKRKTGKNPMGLVFPDFEDGETGLTLGVVNVNESFEVLSSKTIASLIACSKVEVIGVVAADLSAEPVAFIRDRKHERGAPSKLRTLLLNSKSKDFCDRHNIHRYFTDSENNKAWVNMFSHSTQSSFSVIISKINNEKAHSGEGMSFDTYGLSSYKNPVFVGFPDLSGVQL